MGARRKRSRKRSATSTPAPLEPIVFFVDRSLGKSVVTALRRAGASVEAHHDHFQDNAPDAEWLPEVGSRGWIVLTKDKRIRFRPIERDAVLAANLRVFVLATKGNLTGEEICQLFMANLHPMESFARKYPAPFIAGVTRTGITYYDLPHSGEPPEGEK